jgi:hypothetical protein
MNLKCSSDCAACASSTMAGVSSVLVCSLSVDRSAGAMASKWLGDCQKSRSSVVKPV